MKLSARNQLKGKIVDVAKGATTSHVRIDIGGPPAAILLYTLAPDLLLGSPRANRPEECAYMLPVEGSEGDDWATVIAGGSKEVVGEIRVRAIS